MQSLCFFSFALYENDEIVENNHNARQQILDIFTSESKNVTKNNNISTLHFIHEQLSVQIDYTDTPINDNLLFFRIGQEKKYETILIRNKETYSTQGIYTAPNENNFMENYTYFLMDFKLGIISYVDSPDVPSIYIVENMVNYCMSDCITLQLQPIVDPKYVDTLIKGGILIKDIEYSMQMPSNEILSALNLFTMDKNELSQNELFSGKINILAESRMPRYIAGISIPQPNHITTVLYRLKNAMTNKTKSKPSFNYMLGLKRIVSKEISYRIPFTHSIHEHSDTLDNIMSNIQTMVINSYNNSIPDLCKYNEKSSCLSRE